MSSQSRRERELIRQLDQQHRDPKPKPAKEPKRSTGSPSVGSSVYARPCRPRCRCWVCCAEYRAGISADL